MRISSRLFSFRSYALAVGVVLSPALLQQSSSCNPATGDATLEDLQVTVMDEPQISAFDSAQRNYNVWLPLSADTAIVTARPTEAGSEVSYNLSEVGVPGYIDSGYFPTDDWTVTLDGLLPEGRSELRINVKAEGGARAAYSIDIQVGCSTLPCAFPCTEQGILDAISFGGGPHTFDCDGPTTVVTTDTIYIDNDVFLDGEGDLNVDADGELPPHDRHLAFFVPAGVTAELRRLSVSNSFGIENQGNLTVEDVSMLDTVGSLANEGTMTVTNCTVSGTATGFVGAIHNAWLGEMTITNSTVSGNEGIFGAISNVGTMTVLSSTLSGNTNSEGVPWQRPAIVVNGGTVTMKNNVVAGDCGSFDVDVIDVIISGGYNIESPGDTCNFDQGSDQVDVTEAKLKLGDLADNGGPTMTRALRFGSEAIDKIPAEACEVETDQRGEPRPVEIVEPKCDVGAFERQPDDPDP